MSVSKIRQKYSMVVILWNVFMNQCLCTKTRLFAINYFHALNSSSRECFVTSWLSNQGNAMSSCGSYTLSCNSHLNGHHYAIYNSSNATSNHFKYNAHKNTSMLLRFKDSNAEAEKYRKWSFIRKLTVRRGHIFTIFAR